MNIEELIVRIEAMAANGMQAMYAEMQTIGIELVGEIKQDLSSGAGPASRSGALSRSVGSATQATDTRITTAITATAPHAAGMEYGNPPHEIYPRSKQALSFVTSDGARVVTRRVNHPGNKPYRFVGRVVDAKRENIEQRIREAALRGLYGP